MGGREEPCEAIGDFDDSLHDLPPFAGAQARGPHALFQAPARRGDFDSQRRVVGARGGSGHGLPSMRKLFGDSLPQVRCAVESFPRVSTAEAAPEKEMARRGPQAIDELVLLSGFEPPTY